MRSVRLVLVSCFFFSPALARPANTAATPEDEWYIIELQDQACGYMHSTQHQVGNEVRTRVMFDIGISRGETKLRITADQNYRETPDGRPISFEHKTSMGQMPVVQRGTIKGDKLILETSQEGVSSKKTYPFDPEVKFAWGQILEQRKRGIKPGTKFSIKTYDPSVSTDSPLNMEFEVFDKELVDVRGTQRELYKVTSTLVLPQMKIPTESWVDADARPLVINMNLGILKVRVVESTKAEAMKLTGASPEMFFSTLIKVDRKIPKDAKAVTLHLSVPKGGDRLPDIPATGMQTFQRKNDYEGVLRIRRQDWGELRRKPESFDKAVLAPFLQASPIVDINDKKIKLLARKAVRGAKSVYDKADALRLFVTDYIDEKGLDVGFATASEVARNRAGDCSEHGVLLAALARAAGIPARGVSGIVQVPWETLPVEAQSAFGYHMWTQVYIGGQWVDIDGALRQTECDPTHIALTLMPLNDEGLIDSIASLLPLIGRLEIRIEQVDE